MKRLAMALVGFALLATTPAVQANSDDITAQATVLTTLSITGVRDLDLGSVYPGVNKSVAYTDVTAGKWMIAGETGAEVVLDFTTLPTQLMSGA